MKDTPILEIKKLPEGWKTIPAWSMFRRTKRTDFPDEELLSVYREYGVIPKSSRDDNHNVESEDLSAYQLVEVGDLVVNKMKAWQGSLALSRFRGIVSPAYFVYKFSGDGFPKYFHYLLRSSPYIAAYFKISKGVRVGQWDLEPQEFRKLPIVVPPIERQQEIAEFLDKELEDIDRLIELQRELLTNLAEREGRVISDLVTKDGGGARELVDSGIDWLGDIPIGWKTMPFRYLFKESKEINGDTPVGPMLSISSIHGVIEKSYEHDSMKRTNEELETYRVVRKGELAVNTMWLNYGGLGVSELEGHMSPAYRAYSITGDVHPRFIHHLLRSNRYIAGYTKYLTGVRPNSLQMSRENLMRFPILLPPLTEQVSIAQKVDAHLAKTKSLVDECSSFISLLQERKKALIAQAVFADVSVERLQDA